MDGNKARYHVTENYFKHSTFVAAGRDLPRRAKLHSSQCGSHLFGSSDGKWSISRCCQAMHSDTW